MANNFTVNNNSFDTNKVGCSSNRTHLIDPNRFDGQNSSSNVSVPLEDLNISVELTTFKKGRSVLTAEHGKVGTAESVDTVTINFLEGSDINGEKVLTTNYTDLTTVFDKNANRKNESLGITSIDIEFNSSMTPMIVIKFVDVRGSAIFQNEEEISGNKQKNPFGVFFQIPYPLFELTIKGYYGQPVKYCLHMLKFNTRFNSGTGNFEITAEFVGYTYAMFNDMVLGYLRAIPYTKIGKERYEIINTERTNAGLGEIINLDDLMIAISQINEGLVKLTAKDENAMVISNNEGKTDQINKVEDIVNQLGISIDVRHEKNEGRFKYIIYDENLDPKKREELISKYFNDIKIQIEDFNKNGTLSLDFAKFTDFSSNKIFYVGITRNMLNSNDPADKKLLQQKLQITNEVELAAKILDMSKYFKVLTISDTTPYDIYDLTSIYGFIDEVRNNLNNLTKDAKEKLAMTIKENIKGDIGFDPTVRNIIEIFTTAAEVFMETVWSVSSAAENLQNLIRPAQLAEKFIDEKNSDITQEDLKVKKYWPWPAYMEQSEEEGRATYVDRYLGEAGVLTNPKDVDELAFIDDLLAAFLYSQKRRQEAVANINNVETNWIPVNPMDTRALDITDAPYRRIGSNGFINNKEVLVLSLIRGMTFLAHTNSYLTDGEIEKMAEIEATAVLNTIPDDMIRKSLGSITLSDIKKLKNKYKFGFNATTATEFDMLKINGEKVTFNDDILPVNKGFGGDNVRYWKDASDLNRIKLSINDVVESDAIFMGTLNNNNTTPQYDGGYYIKILDKKTFEDNQKELNFYGVTADTTSKIIFENLKQTINTAAAAKAAGFNVFGGTYGIQEFSQMDFGVEGLTELKYSFYRQKSTVGFAMRDTSKPLIYNEFDYGTIITSGGVQKPITPTTTKVATADPIADAWDGIKSLIGNGAFFGRFKNNYDNTGKNWECLKNLSTNNVTYPFIDYPYFDTYNDTSSSGVFSLFGSKWFYGQSLSAYPLYAKGMLFLNSLPFTEFKDLKQLFSIRGGFIHAPKLWVAYIGSLLWRDDRKLPIFDDNNRIIDGGSGPNDPIIFISSIFSGDNDGILPPASVDFSDPYVSPNTDEYLTINRLNKVGGNKKIENTILRLPPDVKQEFKNIFFEFVESSSGNYDFKSLNEEVQIVENGTLANFKAGLDAIDDEFNFFQTSDTIPVSVIQNNFINVDKYKVFLPVLTGLFTDTPIQIALEFKDGYISLDGNGVDTPVKHIIDMMVDEVIISNGNYHTWGDVDPENTGVNYPIFCSEDKFDTYFSAVTKVWSDNMSSAAEREIKKNLEQEIFGTSDENIIKLELYNHCKTVNDKWLAGVQNINNVLFQCGNGDRNSIDLKLAKKYRPNTTTTRLIDSFRFVTRSFADIGDKLYINPMPVGSYLVDNPDSTFYDCVGNLLGSNNFNFIAMPSYINYNDPKELENIFKPMSYYEAAIKGGKCGPAFVCVYVGKTSNHLDSISQYPNDGFDVKCDDNGNLIGLPKDFANSSNDYENDVAIFAVNFSQQNQNIFKDITLDQAEFPETSETLQITDDIAKKGGENNRTLVGQNIYNVHRLRSYKAEVQMMGNVMIQPMMHFQLNNIPMFHGAYLITKAKHSIVPNHMSTTFEGVRIRYAETKLISASDLYMALLDALDLTNTPSGASNGSLGGSFPPIVMTIKENGGSNGKITSDNGNITTAKLIVPKEIRNRVNLYKNEDENLLIAEAVPPLNAMLTEWVKYLSANGFTKNSENTYAYINSAFRTIQHQEDLAVSNPKASAKPQTSNHGWGIAVDFQFFKKDGTIIKTYDKDGNPNVGIGYNYIQNPALKWLVENSHNYGFIIPEGLRNNTGLEEFWHFEYHGNAAKCILAKSNIIKGVTVNTTTPYHSSVINPKGKDGKIPDYTKNCDYITVTADGADFIPAGNEADYWTLVAICALENSTPQGRCDVAQSIYNRLSYKSSGYIGTTIKEQIVEGNGRQYEPVKNAVNEFRAITNRTTAIKAVRKSKSWSEQTATKAINETVTALNNAQLMQSSKQWVNGRTDFYSAAIKDKQPYKATLSKGFGLQTRENQIFGWFVGPGAIKLGKSNPVAANIPNLGSFA
jgi:hypothetical protein